MQNILKTKTEKSIENIGRETIKIQREDILSLYKGNPKSLIGLEYERLSLDKKTLKNASYEKVSKIIKIFSDILSWEILYDNDTIIGARNKNGTSISLEPGMQLEISICPKETILDIDTELSKIVELLDKIAKMYDVIFLGYGISPVSCVDEIKILNKERYQIMNNYLPYCKRGDFCTKMMRKTAGIQVNIDYTDSKDCFLKLKFLNLIMPFMTALSSNSPFEENKLTDKKTQRANVWRYTGEDRCNLFYKEVFSLFMASKNIFRNYINSVLKVPMLYIVRNGQNIPIEGKINFETFLKNGFLEYFPTLEDYILHQSLVFPDVRLKNYIEIRNHDSSNSSFALSLCAFYKGLMKNNLEYLISEFNYLKIEDIDNYNELIVNEGLNIKINSKISGFDIVNRLFELSLKNLDAKDRVYLAPIKEILEAKKTSADFIMDYEIKNAGSLVEFLL